MSDTDETVPTGGAQGGAAAPATAATATATVPVRMSLRPPSRFTAKSDFNLWFMRFELYTGEAKIPDGERVHSWKGCLCHSGELHGHWEQ